MKESGIQVKHTEVPWTGCAQVEGFGNLGWLGYFGGWWTTQICQVCGDYNTLIRIPISKSGFQGMSYDFLITAHLCKVRAGPARLIGKVIFEDHWGDKCVRYQKPLRVRGRLPPRHMEESYVSLIRKYSPNLEGWNFSWCMVSSQSVLCSLKPSKVSLTPNGAFLLGVLGRVRNS